MNKKLNTTLCCLQEIYVKDTEECRLKLKECWSKGYGTMAKGSLHMYEAQDLVSNTEKKSVSKINEFRKISRLKFE